MCLRCSECVEGCRESGCRAVLPRSAAEPGEPLPPVDPSALRRGPPTPARSGPLLGSALGLRRGSRRGHRPSGRHGRDNHRDGRFRNGCRSHSGPDGSDGRTARHAPLPRNCRSGSVLRNHHDRIKSGRYVKRRVREPRWHCQVSISLTLRGAAVGSSVFPLSELWQLAGCTGPLLPPVSCGVVGIQTLASGFGSSDFGSLLGAGAWLVMGEPQTSCFHAGSPVFVGA